MTSIRPRRGIESQTNNSTLPASPPPADRPSLKDHDPTKTELAPLFEEYLEAKRRSQNDKSRNDLRYGFKLFCRYLVGRGLPLTVSSFNVLVVEAYADHLRTRDALPGRRPFDRDRLAVGSQHACLRPVRQLADYLEWAGWIEVSPFNMTYDSVMPKLDGRRRILKRAVAADVKALLDATVGDDP